MKKLFYLPTPWLACLLLLVMAVALPGCKSDEVVSNSYKTLRAAATIYNGVMQAAADLDRRGQLDVAAKEKIIAIGSKYFTAHRVATSALEAYAATARAEDKTRLDQALVEVWRVISDLRAELRSHKDRQKAQGRQAT